MNNNMNSEHEFSYNYDEYKDDVNEISNNNDGKNKKIRIIFIIILLVLFLGGLTFLLVKILGNDNQENKIILKITETLDIVVGETKEIEVNISGINNNNPKINYMSENENIASVNEQGVVTGVSDGTTMIIVTYYDEINNKYNKNCIVSVKKSNEDVEQPIINTNDSEGPNIKYTLPSNVNGWYKGNVVISLNVTDKSGVKSVEYAVNCSDNCSYKDVTNSNKIALTGNGTKNVTIIAIDKNENKTVKNVNIKMDNKSPSAKVNPSGIIYDNTGSVEVCVICTDKESGCKEDKSCQTYYQTTQKSSLIVYDKVGNSTISDEYEIVIDKEKPTCSLTYSDKKITATYKDKGDSGISYYGFNSSYSGTNEKEKSNITAGKYTFYVKDKAGNTNNCSMTCEFTSWIKSGYKTSGTCSSYSKTAAEKAGATWARDCNADGTVKQEWTRTFKCE